MSEAVPIEHPSRLTVGDFAAADEPLRLFGQWLEDATQREPADPNAMALATVDPDGLPDVRMVLLKGFDERGAVFYTNMDSQKGRQLDASPKAALLFHWKSLCRQVRLRGAVERVVDLSPHPNRHISPESCTQVSGEALESLTRQSTSSKRPLSSDAAIWGS